MLWRRAEGAPPPPQIWGPERPHCGPLVKFGPALALTLKEALQHSQTCGSVTPMSSCEIKNNVTSDHRHDPTYIESILSAGITNFTCLAPLVRTPKFQNPYATPSLTIITTPQHLCSPNKTIVEPHKFI
jgi:hypothetical protein